jgi:DNA-binding response OmpR family regulator
MDTILLVEDDRFFRDVYSNLLHAEGYQVETASSGAAGLEMLGRGQYALVITDLILPDISGLEILTRVRESHPTVDVIMVTGNANLESAILALKLGARDYLVKPVNPDEFMHSVAQCIRQRHLLDENLELKPEFREQYVTGTKRVFKPKLGEAFDFSSFEQNLRRHPNVFGGSPGSVWKYSSSSTSVPSSSSTT